MDLSERARQFGIFKDHRLEVAANSPWLFPILLTLTTLALFADCIGPDIVFAYRVAVHFYPPLYELVRDEWLAGRIPLWNPLLNCGQPLAGMATAGVFYPPQLLLSLLLPSPMAVNIYGIGHLVFAAAGAYLLARQQRLSRPAASAAGLAYGFSGSLLFQVYNPIFAAGGAWLAWAVLFGWRLLQKGGLKNTAGLAAALAFSVLCGDPQAGYHAGLLLGLAVLLLRLPVLPSAVGLALAAGLAGLMALVQIALAAEFIQDTARSMDLAPQSVWQLPEFFARGQQAAERANWYDIMIGRPPRVARQYFSTYGFSVPPWRAIEVFWPGFAGGQGARWSLWAKLERPDVWVASLYAGVITAMLGIVGGWLCRRRAARLWLLVFGVSFWLSLGGYGGIGLVRNGLLMLTGQFDQIGYRPGDEVGGPYWWLTTFLPGYSGFRYPAKWLTVMALAGGQLAGFGCDQLRRSAGRRLLTWLSWPMVCAGVLATVLAATVTAALKGWQPGSLEPPEWVALFAVVSGGLQVAGISMILWILLRKGVSVAVPLLCLLVIDLTVGGRGDLVVGHHRSLTEAASYLDAVAEVRLPAMAAVQPRMRVAVKNAASPLVTLLEPERYVAYLGMTTMTHTPWLFDCGVVGEQSTAMQADADLLFRPLIDEGGTIAPRRAYDLCGVEYFIVTNSKPVVESAETLADDWSPRQKQGEFEGLRPHGGPLPKVPFALPGEPAEPPLIFAVRNKAALPRVRIVRNAVLVPAVSKTDWDYWIDLLKRIAFPDAELPDLTHNIVIERHAGGDEVALPLAMTGDFAAGLTDACRLLIDEPQRVVIEATLTQPGFVVLADSFHRDWRLQVASNGQPVKPVPILRANRLHRACRLPAGHHVLDFHYRSGTFGRTVWVSVVAWLIAAGCWLGGWSRRTMLTAEAR